MIFNLSGVHILWLNHTSFLFFTINSSNLVRLLQNFVHIVSQMTYGLATICTH